jgi:septal ring factor EnvC (AmiA/AmiB activator)
LGSFCSEGPTLLHGILEMMATPTFGRTTGRNDFPSAGIGSGPWCLRSLVLLCAVILPLTAVRAEDHPSARDLAAMRKQIEAVEREATSEQRRFDESERRIRQLASQLQDMEAQNQRLNQVAQKLTSSNSQIQSETDRRFEELQQQRSENIPRPSSTSRSLATWEPISSP